MNKTTLPYWRLRRLSPRVLAVLLRHADSQPVIAAYLQTIGISAKTFRDLYDLALAQRGDEDIGYAGGKLSIAKLHRMLRAWVSLAAAEIPSLDRSEYGDNPTVRDDVISDTEQFLLYVANYEAKTGSPLAFTDSMREDLTQALEEAKSSVATVSDAAAARSATTTELRAAAMAFNRDLVAFRRSLAALFGTKHADYQKLRTAKTQTRDVDDDQVDDDMPPADEPSIAEAFEDAVAEGNDAEEAAE